MTLQAGFYSIHILLLMAPITLSLIGFGVHVLVDFGLQIGRLAASS